MNVKRRKKKELDVPVCELNGIDVNDSQLMYDVFEKFFEMPEEWLDWCGGCKRLWEYGFAVLGHRDAVTKLMLRIADVMVCAWVIEVRQCESEKKRKKMSELMPMVKEGMWNRFLKLLKSWYVDFSLYREGISVLLERIDQIDKIAQLPRTKERIPKDIAWSLLVSFSDIYSEYLLSRKNKKAYNCIGKVMIKKNEVNDYVLSLLQELNSSIEQMVGKKDTYNDEKIVSFLLNIFLLVGILNKRMREKVLTTVNQEIISVCSKLFVVVKDSKGIQLTSILFRDCFHHFGNPEKMIDLLLCQLSQYVAGKSVKIIASLLCQMIVETDQTKIQSILDNETLVLRIQVELMYCFMRHENLSKIWNRKISDFLLSNISKVPIDCRKHFLMSIQYAEKEYILPSLMKLVKSEGDSFAFSIIKELEFKNDSEIQLFISEIQNSISDENVATRLLNLIPPSLENLKPECVKELVLTTCLRVFDEPSSHTRILTMKVIFSSKVIGSYVNDIFDVVGKNLTAQSLNFKGEKIDSSDDLLKNLGPYLCLLSLPSANFREHPVQDVFKNNLLNKTLDKKLLQLSCEILAKFPNKSFDQDLDQIEKFLFRKDYALLKVYLYYILQFSLQNAVNIERILNLSWKVLKENHSDNIDLLKSQQGSINCIVALLKKTISIELHDVTGIHGCVPVVKSSKAVDFQVVNFLKQILTSEDSITVKICVNNAISLSMKTLTLAEAQLLASHVFPCYFSMNSNDEMFIHSSLQTILIVCSILKESIHPYLTDLVEFVHKFQSVRYPARIRTQSYKLLLTLLVCREDVLISHEKSMEIILQNLKKEGLLTPVHKHDSEADLKQLKTITSQAQKLLGLVSFD